MPTVPRGSRSRNQNSPINGSTDKALKIKSPPASIAVVTAIAASTPRICRHSRRVALVAARRYCGGATFPLAHCCCLPGAAAR